MTQRFAARLTESFFKAWDLFLDIPFPGGTRYDSEDDSLAICWAPVLGAVLGVGSYLIAWIISTLGGRIAGAALAPFAILALWELVNRGKDSGNLTRLIRDKLFPPVDADNTDSVWKENQMMAYNFVFVGLLVTRVTFIGTLVYLGQFGWVAVTTILVFSAQASLARRDTPDTLIAADPREEVGMWVLAGLFCLVAGGWPAGLAAMVLVALAAWRLKTIAIVEQVLNGPAIGMLGRVMEIAILAFGLIFLGKK